MIGNSFCFTLLLTLTIVTKPSASQNCKSAPPDVAFVIDVSSSICDTDPLYVFGRDSICNNFKNYMSFVYDITSSFDIGSTATLVAMMRFGSTVRVDWLFNRYTDKASLLAAIQRISYVPGETTATAQALRVVRTQVFGQAEDRPSNPNLAIVITDGIPNPFDENNFNTEVANLRQTNIQVFVIGVTSATNDAILQKISSPPQIQGKNWFKSATFEALNIITTEVILQIQCNSSSFTTTTTTDAISSTSIAISSPKNGLPTYSTTSTTTSKTTSATVVLPINNETSDNRLLQCTSNFQRLETENSLLKTDKIVIGIVVGVLAFIAGAILGSVCVYRYHKKNNAIPATYETTKIQNTDPHEYAGIDNTALQQIDH